MPTCLPSWKLPNDCALSSITMTPCDCNLIISSVVSFDNLPLILVTNTTPQSGGIFLKSMVHEVWSISTKHGKPPKLIAPLTVAACVYALAANLTPGRMPAIMAAMCNPAVALVTMCACALFVYSHILSSSSRVNLCSMIHPPEDIYSDTRSRSACVYSGFM